MSLARRTVHADRPIQLGLIAEGMIDDRSPLEDVFALWADRVADLNRAITAHDRAVAAGHPCIGGPA